MRATRAFVEAMGELGVYYLRQYNNRGNRDVIGALSAEEANLLHARQLARQHCHPDEGRNGWYYPLISTMQGLRQLYQQTGRRAAWQQLVTEIVPDFVDPTTDGPLPGREEQWSLVTEYRVRLAQEARQWAEALRLQRAQVEWTRQRAAAALALPRNEGPTAQLNSSQRNAIRTLAASLAQLGHIQREQGLPTCAASYEEAANLLQRVGDQPEEAIIAFNLGHAYYQIPALHDLEQAEQCYQRSYDLRGGPSRAKQVLGPTGVCGLGTL